MNSNHYSFLNVKHNFYMAFLICYNPKRSKKKGVLYGAVTPSIISPLYLLSPALPSVCWARCWSSPPCCWEADGAGGCYPGAPSPSSDCRPDMRLGSEYTSHHHLRPWPASGCGRAPSPACWGTAACSSRPRWPSPSSPGRWCSPDDDDNDNDDDNEDNNDDDETYLVCDIVPGVGQEAG